MTEVPPQHIAVKRGDAVYSAHSYLTKVPVTAIMPFIEAFTRPEDLVLDPFAGSGMTGVAAALAGRRAELRDINVLGQHIGENYVNLVGANAYRAAADDVMDATRLRIGAVYAVTCRACQARAELSRTVYSYIYGCPGCGGDINYYRSLETAYWAKSRMVCPHCRSKFGLRGAQRRGEEPVLETVSCQCSRTLVDQEPTNSKLVHPPDGLAWPDARIEADRQMYHASALGKNGLDSTAAFFSLRNLTALAALRDAMAQVPDAQIRDKLMFAFTAILARASKRYQWSRQRPLNAAHQHYYIAPVFYEWNVLDLFSRKVDAIVRSDDYIRERLGAREPQVRYRLGSADAVDLPDCSVDYVFTDPPFGSNIFYSDMSLFQEAWLGHTTAHEQEAVVDRTRTSAPTRRSAARYEELIANSLCECHRVLKPGRWLSIVFSNSSGAMWALLQRAVATAGFDIESGQISVLDKGQRSVKGLASGFENVVTADLILSMRKTEARLTREIRPAPAGFFDLAIERAVRAKERETPTHVYLGVIREYLRNDYDVGAVDMVHIAGRLKSLGYDTDEATGTLRHIAPGEQTTIRLAAGR